MSGGVNGGEEEMYMLWPNDAGVHWKANGK